MLAVSHEKKSTFLALPMNYLDHALIPMTHELLGLTADNWLVV